MSLAISIARSIAPLCPEITTWPGSLSLATVHTSPCAAASAIRCASSTSAPSSAAIAPTPTGTAACIACPRSLSSLAVVAQVERSRRAQGRIFAEAVPGDELRRFPRSTPPSRVSAANTAIELAMIAGWAFSVSLSSSSGPSRISRNRFWPERLVDLLEHVARGAAGFGQRRAHADRLAALPRKKECAHDRSLSSSYDRARLGRRRRIAKAGGASAWPRPASRRRSESG